MCKKQKDETWVEFFFRMFGEEPQTILAFVGFSIAVGLYMDGRDLLKEMTCSYQTLSREVLEMKIEIKSGIHEANIRLDDASNRISKLEDWHKFNDSKKNKQ